MPNHFRKPSGRPTDSALTDAMRDSISSRASDIEVVEIHKKYLVPRKDQPRKHFPQAVLDERRVQLERESQHSPITVFPPSRGEDGEQYYEILDGECRWRSVMQSDQIDYLRAEIYRGDPSDKAAILIAQLAHNDDGSEPLTPLEKAYAYRELVNHLKSQGVKAPVKVAADRLGKSQAVFSELLSLSEMPEDLGKFSLVNGISDAKVLNGMTQVFKRGKPQDLKLMQKRISEGLEKEENLRGVVREYVDKVKARVPNKTVEKTSGSKSKSARKLTAKELKLESKEDGSGVLIVETSRELIRINIDKAQMSAIKAGR